MWAGYGVVVALSLALIPISIILVPLLVLGWINLSKHSRVWPEMLGIADGLAIVALMVGIANLNSRACADIPDAPGKMTSSISCGGASPTPFLVAGIVSAFGGLFGYAVTSYLKRRSL